MPIEVELPDGTIAEFPEGTSNATMEMALAKYRQRPLADFSDIRSKKDSTEQWTPEELARRYKAQGINPVTDPNSGVGFFRKYYAGLGKSGVDTVQGAQQLFTDSSLNNVGLLARGLDAVGLDSASKSLLDVVGKPLLQASESQRARTAERRKIDAPLLDSGGGMFGNIVGTTSQILGPGLLARGTMAAPVLLPRTIAGNVAQGAVVGASQPVVGDGERLANTAIGASLGGAGAALPKAVGATYRALRAPFRPFTEAGQNEAVAQILRGSASDPQRLMTAAPSAVPGVQRTLAEETLDPGIASLQRAVQARGAAGAEMVTQRQQNNAARMGLLDQFAGDEAQIAAAEAARDARAMPFLNQALQQSGVDKAPVIGLLDQEITANATRPTVQAALNDVKTALAKAGGDVQSLYGLRKYIDDLLQNRAGSEKGYAQAATHELMQIKGQLDAQIKAASPQFGQYLDEYVAGSRPIDRMETGQEIIRRSTGAIQDAVGNYSLTPMQFGRTAKNLDAAARKATGFESATAARVLEPEDLSSIGKIQDDLNRQAFADTANRQGSDTYQKLMNEGNILGALQEVGVSVPGGGILKMLGSRGREHINSTLAAVMADPAQARAILSRVSPYERRIVQDLLSRSGGLLGSSGPALAE